MRVRFHAVIAVLAFSAGATKATAADLVVRVSGHKSNNGEIGCSLHKDGREFPMGHSRSQSIWKRASSSVVDCRFEGLAPGIYAVAVSHDLNGNRRTDTNMLGIPTESWGVSNNARPLMRSPTFDEAKFEIKPEGPTTINVRIDQ